MAITLLTTAGATFSPVYNPVVYGFDSTNKTQPGFRYVVDVYPAGLTAPKLAEFRIAPRPVDGYGYIDLSKILSSKLSFDFRGSSGSGSINAVNSYISYDIEIGEEYSTAWPFADTTFMPGSNTLLGPTSGVSGIGATHTFVVGDQIIVDQASDLIPLAEGLHTVYSVPNQYSIEIQVPFQSTPTNPGTVRYADNRNTVYRGLLVLKNNSVYNAAFPFKSWPSYSPSQYTIGASSSTNLLLTNLPDNFYATPTQDIHVNIGTNGQLGIRTFRFQNDNGELFSKNSFLVASSIKVMQTGVGPNNNFATGVLAGTPQLIKPNTKFYDFWAVNTAGDQLSKKYRVFIDRRCSIEDYEIAFLDRLGSFSSYSFQLRSRESGTVNREMFNKQVGNITGGKWTYSLTDQGDTITDVTVKKEYELSTNWMTHDMNVYFEELVTSPVTFVKIQGVYYSCTILDTSFEVQSVNYKKLIRRTVRIRLANENIINI